MMYCALCINIFFLQQIPAQDITDAIIDLNDVRQVISGFGAANILQWRPDMNTGDIEKAFGTDEGQIGFTILRLRIPPSATEFRNNITTAQAACARGVKIIGSPWSPPAYMKSNNNLVAGRLRQDAYAAYAEYLKSFVDFMAENGVPIYAVSVQNEPDVRVDYESCDWNAGEMLSFVKENAPAIGTNIIAPESFHFDHALSDPILNDDIAVANVSIIGGHLYGGGLESYPLAGSKGKQIWMTEYLDTDTTWNRVLATGKQMNDCMTAGMSAYIWWYIVRFYGPIGEDGNVTKRGYIMSQYSRFIRPGYERINATERPQRRLYVTAYKSDSNVIIVVVNQSSSPAEQTFGIQGIYAREPVFTPYVTSRTKNCLQESDLQVNKGSFTVIFEGESVTTLVGENVIDSTQTPQTITLYQNFPNPFYQSTKISYTVPSSGIVSLKVFNVLGQEIKTLVHAYHDTGEYKVLFNAMNLSCGIYFYTLKVGDNSAVTKKMLLIH